MPRFAWCLLAALLPASLGAQAAPILRVGRPVATHPHEFSQLRAVRELRDGRVLAADWIEERVLALDLARGTAVAVGRSGRGPDEYRLPADLIALPGDSTLLVDQGNSRVALIGPDLTIRRSWVPSPGGAGWQFTPRAADARGRLYFTIPSWTEAGQAPGDSVVLARWDPATDRVERLAHVLAAPRLREPSRDPRIPMLVFAPADAWLADDDGTVFLVRVEGYRVERLRSGATPVVGPSLGAMGPAVTDADRRAFAKAFLMSSPMSGRGPDGGMGHTPAAMAEGEALERLLRASRFAERHPPFSASGAWCSPTHLWVARSVPAGAAARYDLLTRDGRRAATVELPAGRRIVGLGRHLYLAAPDEDGLERLEAYALPSP